MHTQVVRIFLISLTTLAVVHILALRFFLYWRYEWFDIPMHLFGGAIVALGVLAARDLHIPFFDRLVTFKATIVVVLFVAVIWELFEFIGGISVIQESFVLDTATDLIAGIIGGSIGYIVGRSIAELDA
ncbi:MAG: hypothetical protein WDZ68_01400 [Candidatus Paceibacterota bacterium]